MAVRRILVLLVALGMGANTKEEGRLILSEFTHPADNLDDVIITGYRNDNYGCYGNSDDKIKSSFVGLAMEDCENNGAVVFSGCEQMDLSSIVLDWGGCLIASLGVVTAHHHKAIDFFDYYMTGILGERNLFGHSKGGNLATYVYINRLDENTNAYCVNAQPYCWYTMSDNQKAALKTDRFGVYCSCQ